jgi:hypothetical protein
MMGKRVLRRFLSVELVAFVARNLFRFVQIDVGCDGYDGIGTMPIKDNSDSDIMFLISCVRSNFLV